MGKVFISYSSKDRERCAGIVTKLEQNGLECWVAPRDIRPGAMWMDSVTEAIDESTAVLLLVTAHSNGSNQVRREIERAVSRSKPIVPFILDEVQFSKWMQYSISIHHWHTSQCSDLKRDIEGVLQSLREIGGTFKQTGKDTASSIVASEPLMRLFTLERKVSLLVRYCFSEGEVPEDILQGVLKQVSSELNEIVVKYELTSRYTEKKTEFAYSLPSAVINEEGRARLLAAALNLYLILDSLRSDPGFRKYGFRSEVILFPGENPDAGLSNSIAVDIDSRQWLHDKGIEYPGEPESTLTVLEGFCKRSDSVLPECDLVGRDAEVATLIAMIDKQQYWHVENPRGFAVHLIAAVSGSAGVGKTALLNHLTEEIGSNKQILILRGNATEGNLWLSVLADIIGMETSEGLTGDVVRTAIHESFDIAVSQEDALSIARFLSGKKLFSDTEQAGSSVSVQVALRNFLSALASEKDMVFLLEDIHKADSFSMKVFRFLLANTERQRPYVFIITFRPGLSENALVLDVPEGYFVSESVNLTGLGRNDLEEFCGRLLSSGDSAARCSSELIDLVQQRTEGNPLYIREFIESLLQRDAIRLTEGVWELTENAGIVEISANLKHMYDARLQSLDDSSRLFLRCLSVLGERIPVKLMNSYLDCISLRTSSMTGGYLDELEGFIRLENSAFRRTAVFNHALLRDHLYTGLSDEQKRVLHTAAAQTLAEYPGADPGDISLHYRSAGEDVLSLEWGEKKANLLSGIHDSRGVLEWTERLLVWASDKEEFAETVFRLRKLRYLSLSAMGDRQPREDELEAIREQAFSMNDDVKKLEVSLMNASFLTQTGEMARAGEMLSDLEKQVTHSDDKGFLFKYYDAAGRHAQLDYRMKEALDFNEKALTLAVSTADEVRIKHRLASIIDGKGDHDHARELMSEALASARSIHNPVQEISVLNAIAKSYFEKGDWAEAEDHWNRAIRLAGSTGNRRTEAMMLNLLGHMLSKTKTIEEAMEMQRKALAVMEESGNRQGVSKVLDDIGILYTRMGAKDKALQTLERSLEISREMQNTGGIGSALANISTLQKELGEYEEAEKNIREAIAIWRETGYRQREASCISNLGSILERRGQMDNAVDCFRKAIEIGEEIGDREGNSSRYGNFAVMMQIKHNFDQAEAYYEKAIAVCKEIGNKKMLGAWSAYKSILYDTIGRREEALEGYRESISMLKEVGDKQFLLLAMGNLSGLLAKMGRDEESLQIINEKLRMCREIGYRVDEASALCSLGHYHLKEDHCDEAFNCFKDACEIASEKKIGIHLFRGIMPLYRILKEKGFTETDDCFPKHWGDPGNTLRDSHMPEKQGKKDY